MAGKDFQVGARVAAGVSCVVAAAALVAAAVIAVPGPTNAATDATGGLLVTPQAIEQQRTCPGPLLLVGAASGQDATTLTSVGSPALTMSPEATSQPLDDVDVVTSDSGATSTLVSAPPAADGGVLAVAQAQVASEADLSGLAVVNCSESAAVTWLVGGATDTGRTTLLVLTNSSEVDATADVELYTGDGRVEALGLTDVTVPPLSQRVLSIAGFAPGAPSIVVKVESSGGLVAATLQQSIVRGLEPGGTEFIGATAEPAETQVIPGVRITTADAVAERAQVGGSLDVATALRVFVPGAEDAEVMVGVVADTSDVEGTTMSETVPAGEVLDIPIEGLADGTYTVTIESSFPVVAAVRASTVAPPDPNAPISDLETSFEFVDEASDITIVAGQRIDLAWFVAAEPLDESVTFATADAPSPRLTLTSPTGPDAEVTITAANGETLSRTVSAGSTTSFDLASATLYTITGAEGMVASTSYTADGQLAAFPVRAANPLSGAITVYR